MWVFLHEFPALTGDRAKQFRKRRREYEHRVEEVLKAGLKTGEFRELDPREVSTWTDARTIIDGRNCLDAGAWRAAGWTYHGLGRP